MSAYDSFVPGLKNMQLPFLNRDEEKKRLSELIEKGSQFAAIYGRRRCGKSRLLREVLPRHSSVYYIGDEREATLQRESLAKEISRLIQGFDQVSYPQWESLFDRWWKEAPSHSTLCIDEFPYLVQSSPELPSVLQKKLDQADSSAPSLILCGSSQMMMHGLVLDGAAPLYGRAREILRIKPLSPKYLAKALPFLSSDPEKAFISYMLWGGIPRYWELAKDYLEPWDGFQDLVLNNLGPLYAEAERLLHEDFLDPAQALSILSLIGTGCHRPSEVAGRLGKPLSSLARPLSKLIDLQLIEKEIPFMANPKTNKQVIYKISDPFMAMWYEHVLPYRSLLEQGSSEAVRQIIISNCNSRKADIWETLSRQSVHQLDLGIGLCLPAKRWWGTGLDRSKIELDVVTQTIHKDTLIVGEVKLNISPQDIPRLHLELKQKANLLPFRQEYKNLKLLLFSVTPCESSDIKVIDANTVFALSKGTSEA
jgi:uncharacterized protein